MTPDAVKAWLAAQEAGARQGVERLRRIIRSVEAPWVETIKWNAPSFALDGEDRVTLGLNPKGGWRVVLHRGAAGRADAFVFEDRTGLARWPSADRGVVQFRDLAAIDAKADELTRLIRDWVEATRA